MAGAIVVFTLAGLLGGLVLISLAAHRRKQAMEWLAEELELRYRPDRDPKMGRRFRFVEPLNRGENWYARHTFSGSYRGHRVIAGDFHCDVPGFFLVRHRACSLFLLLLPGAVPKLTIGGKESTFGSDRKLKYDDVNFESYEFSRRFRVRAADKKFAHDVCHAALIRYLLANDDLSVQLEHVVLALVFNRRLSPGLIEHNLDRLVEIRRLLPGYLFPALTKVS